MDGWSLPKFKGEALKAYSGICRALASGNQNNLRQVRQDEEWPRRRAAGLLTRLLAIGRDG